MVRSYDYSTMVYQRAAEVIVHRGVVTEQLERGAAGHVSCGTDPNGSAYDTFGHYSVKVAAKTGTAQTGSDSTANGMFICYAPYDDPQVWPSPSVEHAGAGKSLAPIAKSILTPTSAARTP